ncbi:hypothetical protein N7466_007132 [Penicillium verhagenii]|uniref:uncharacterized protein n=1 Tax=Penicillium verhagenii TaxID=1562060 RepID=UPI002544EE5A|nr:uncharacterized protein N7466_007132 [Penicillium verhagenii]KAJ5928176.1 hypothetical protein N7466_007132 [Penicillium verhagenii]
MSIRNFYTKSLRLSGFRTPRWLLFNLKNSCQISKDLISDEPLFIYTSGRFLYNESKRLDERNMSFDAAALKIVVQKHVGHGNVKSFVKLSEGGFNQVLLATMEDDFRAIAKIHTGYPSRRRSQPPVKSQPLRFFAQRGYRYQKSMDGRPPLKMQLV